MAGWIMPIRQRTVAFAVTVIAGFTLVIPGAAHAVAPGGLDPSFGSGGVIGGPAGSQFFGVAVQANGEVVAAGQAGGSIMVERFSPSGAAESQYTGGAGVARAAAIQADGKIIIAGASGGMFLERFNPNGSPDASFGHGGAATVSSFGSAAVANAVAVAPDGKIVLAGCSSANECLTSATATKIAVARFNANGTPDTSFGSGGAEVVDFGLPAESAEGVAVQGDGKIVLAGHEQGSNTYAYIQGIVVRLNSNGSLDGSFGGSGVVSFLRPGGGSGSDTLNAVALQNDGRIVVAGADINSAGPTAFFLRLNSGGSFDSSFGSGGAAYLSAGTFTTQPAGAYGVGIAGGGRIVGAGAAQLNGTDFRAGLFALTGGGAPESTFGTGGIVETQTGAEACALAIAPDGDLVIAGDSVSAFGNASGPCSSRPGASPSGFVARYGGYGPPPQRPINGAPSVATGRASAITTISATVSGQVNPNGLPTSYQFEFGPNAVYGLRTPASSAGSGSTARTVSMTLTGLAPSTTYDYRIVGTSPAGRATGSGGTFTTAPAGRPFAHTGAARSIHEVSAMVTGTVTTKGLPTTYHVDYGTHSSYGLRTNSAVLPAATSTDDVAVRLSGLRPGTIYHYRLAASNSLGRSYGAALAFKTEPRVAARLGSVSRAYSIATIAKSGIPLSVSCNQPASLTASLVISPGAAKRLRLGHGSLTIGRAFLSPKHAGTTRVIVRLTMAAIVTLRRAGTVRTTLRVTLAPVGGGLSTTLTKSIALNP